MRLADIILESIDIRGRYQNEPYEFLTDLKTQLIDPKKAEQLLVEWLTASKNIGIGTFLNDLRIFKSFNLNRYPAVVKLVDSYKSEIIKGMLKILFAPDGIYLISSEHTVKMMIDTVKTVGLMWPEFAAIERSINSNKLKEADYDDIEYDDNRTPDIETAKKYIRQVKSDFDQFGELLIGSTINGLLHVYNLDLDQMLQVLEPIKSDIIVYINTQLGKGGFDVYRAVRSVDKLHNVGINWPEINRTLDNHKHGIVSFILHKIKDSSEGIPGVVTEMVIILIRMGITWPELKMINRSIKSNRQLDEDDNNKRSAV